MKKISLVDKITWKLTISGRISQVLESEYNSLGRLKSLNILSSLHVRIHVPSGDLR
jgi:hypothetical protein